MGLRRRRPEPDPNRHAAEQLQHELAVLDAVLEQYSPGHRLNFGTPCRCPSCGEFGFVAATNHDKGITHHTCFRCHLDWTITMRALVARQHRQVLGGAATPARIDLSSPLRPSLPPSPTGVANDGAAAAVELSTSVRSDPLQLLIVDDSRADAALVESILRPMTPHEVQIAHVPTRHEGERAAQLGFDVVLLDLDLPDSRGMRTLQSFREACPEPPLCVCTGTDSVDHTWRTLAQGLLHKQELPRLVGSRRAGAIELLGVLLHTSRASLPVTPPTSD